MCGLAGLLAIDDALTLEEIENLQAMGVVLAHRGPDDSGCYVDPQNRCGFSFRRLAVIDVEGGRQPIANEDQTVWVACNGEIYNFQDLRRELTYGGHRFATRCDVEVIVHLYEDHGRRCLEKLHGMFAVALWDQRRGRLLLAVDRAGKKPLYYSQIGRRLAFGSELKALRRWRGFRADIDEPAVLDYLATGYIGPIRSIYRQVRKVPPGHYLTFDAATGRWGLPVPYWRLSGATTQSYRGTYRQACAELEQRLLEAVKLRLISDVPLGVLLSGGLDSSIVTALMVKAGADDVKTFSAGFEQQRYNELPLARALADHVGSRHTELMIQPPSAQQALEIAAAFDEPFGDSSAIPTYLICRLTRRHVTVALTGDGGDELFGGYWRYRAIQAIKQALTHRAGALTGLLEPWLTSAEHRSVATYTRRFLQACRAQSPGHAYASLIGPFAAPHCVNIIGPRLQRFLPDHVNAVADIFEAGAYGADPAGAAMWTDFHIYLPCDLLTKIDRASMAHGLECRCPILDHHLAEFAFSLPIKWRTTRLAGKRILRDTFGQLLPPILLKAPKRGFGVPIGAWLRNQWRDLVGEFLSKPLAAEEGWVSENVIKSLVREHQARQADHGHRLWVLIVLEAFLRSKPAPA